MLWRANPYREARMIRNGFRLIRAIAVAFAFFVGIIVDISPAVWQSGTVISQAEAVIGRPATPGSVAGVARRSSRRAVRRHYY
jgi:hypothetical protein